MLAPVGAVYVGKETVENDSPLGITGDMVMRLADRLPAGPNFKCSLTTASLHTTYVPSNRWGFWLLGP
jgi:hypothetical protein